MFASTRRSVLHPDLSDHCLLPISRHIRVSSSRSAAARWRDLGIARFAISPVRLSRSPSAHLVRDDTDTRTCIGGYPRPILRRLSHCTLWRGAVTASNSGGPARERAPHVAARSAAQPHGQLGDGSGHHSSECEVPEALRWRTRWQTPLLLFDDADLDKALPRVEKALTVFAGQFCMTAAAFSSTDPFWTRFACASRLDSSLSRSAGVRSQQRNGPDDQPRRFGTYAEIPCAQE